MIRLGFLGPKGTFSELAASTYGARQFPDQSLELIPIGSIPTLFTQLENDSTLDAVIIPIENSIEGPVVIAQDMMAQSDQLWIQDEFSIPIINHLLVLPGTDWRQVTDVVSHPQPLGQCRQFLSSAFVHSPRLHMADSTARAAEFVSRREPVAAGVDADTTAAIGSDGLAHRYGLEIAVPSIQDTDTNRTRFWVVGRVPSLPTGNDKTTIIFSTLKDRPGGLVDILTEVSARGINMTSISSRPTKLVLGDYLFFVDMVGHASKEPLQSALATIKKNASYFKWVGSYRVIEELSC